MLQWAYWADETRHGSLRCRRVGASAKRKRTVGLFDRSAMSELRGGLVEEAEERVALVSGDGFAAVERRGLGGRDGRRTGRQSLSCL